MNKKIFFFTLICLTFIGCTNINQAQPKHISQINEPLWLDNPQKLSNGKITAVGCAGLHYKGVNAQKKLAVQRAIDEIAMQVKTKVSKVSLRHRTNNSSSSSSSSLQEVDNLNISTKIMEYYKKPSGDICVWVIKE